MELHTKSNIYLLTSGVLLAIIGGLFTWLVLPPQVNEVVVYEALEAPVEVPREAPEGYERPVWQHQAVVALPSPALTGDIPLESTLATRRSRREFDETPVTLSDFGQMLWSGQGITSETGGRTAPSARNNYPTRLYVVVDRVEGLEAGLYEYLPASHSVGLLRAGDMVEEWDAITGQPHPKNAAFTILMGAAMTSEGVRKPAYQEAGHVAQNFYLQAEARELAMTVMGGFESPAAVAFIGTDEFEEITYLVPVGNRAPVVAESTE